MTTAARHAALVLAGTLACHPAHPEAQPAVNPCRPATGTLPRTATAIGLAGDYRLHLAATAGASAGRWVDVALRVRPVDDSVSREVVVLGVRDTTSSFPLSGTTDLDPGALGAVPHGNLSAEDPGAPGVLVIERHPARRDAATEIMLRLGADANRRGVSASTAAISRSPFGESTTRASRAPGRAGPGSGRGGVLLRRAAGLEGVGASGRRCRTGPAAMAAGPVEWSGGAGNRTLVRVSIQNRVYVRRLGFLPSPRAGAEPTSPRPIS